MDMTRRLFTGFGVPSLTCCYRLDHKLYKWHWCEGKTGSSINDHHEALVNGVWRPQPDRSQGPPILHEQEHARTHAYSDTNTYKNTSQTHTQTHVYTHIQRNTRTRVLTHKHEVGRVVKVGRKKEERREER